MRCFLISINLHHVPVLKKLSISKLSALPPSSASADWETAMEAPTTAKFKNCFRLCIKDELPSTSISFSWPFKTNPALLEFMLLEVNASAAVSRVNANAIFIVGDGDDLRTFDSTRLCKRASLHSFWWPVHCVIAYLHFLIWNLVSEWVRFRTDKIDDIFLRAWSSKYVLSVLKKRERQDEWHFLTRRA